MSAHYKTKYEAVRAIDASHTRRSVSNVIELIAASAGKTVADTITGGRLGGNNPDEYEDGVYAVLFTDGSGLMVDYTSGSPGYSEYTPGWPGSVEYFVLESHPEHGRDGE